MTKIEVDILKKSDYYTKLANYDETNKAANLIIVANAGRIKKNMEHKKVLTSNVPMKSKVKVSDFAEEIDM